MILDSEILLEEARPPEDFSGQAEFALDTLTDVLSASSVLDETNWVISPRGSTATGTFVQGSDLDFILSFEPHKLTQPEITGPDAQTQQHHQIWETMTDRVHHVLSASINSGTKVNKARKCIKLEDSPDLMLPVDLVTSIGSSAASNGGDTSDGIIGEDIEFWTRDKEPELIHYKYNHIRNSADKDNRTNGRYIEAVRALKIVRRTLVDSQEINPDFTGSYQLESMLHNMPDNYFEFEVPDIIRAMMERVRDEKVARSLTDINIGQPLIGPGILQWAPRHFRTFIKAADQLTIK